MVYIQEYCQSTVLGRINYFCFKIHWILFQFTVIRPSTLKWAKVNGSNKMGLDT